LYLADHCLYFAGSEYGRQGAPVLSMPLTGSMEIMAEAAARLSPGQKVIGFKDMQAGRWMNVDQGGAPITLSIAAEFRDSSSIRVAIRSGNGKSGDLLAECTVVVGSRFPELLSPAPLTLKNARPPQTTGRGIYTEHRMFHGPSFQGVLDLDLTGEDGVSGTLEVLPAGKLFRSDPNPRMQIDPFLLDAAGQMVGYWPVEYLSEGFVALPIRVGELILYRENLLPGERAKCNVRIRSVSARQLKADIDVVGPDGTLWMRVLGWEDWRFYWQRHIYEFWRFPELGTNGVPVRLSTPADTDFECRRLEPLNESDKTGLWESLWMRMVLSAEEISDREALIGAETKSAWLTERAIAKDAVRMWVKRNFSLDVFPPDVTMSVDAEGRMHGSIPGSDLFPFVSSCAIGQVGFAAAGNRPVGVAMTPVDGNAESAHQTCRTAAVTRLLGGRTPPNGPLNVTSVADGPFIFSIAFE
ncbi:MAG: beta-ketoacyl synthase, partial [Bryobacterales bacterium]|nr:beta-ketoacyl synthase [Bryobacterales bacterium]